MAELTLECETVTPLFLGGADPRGAPELRPPSLRGALRYWFRALLAEMDLAGLRQREAAVFGSQERLSPLGIRLSFAKPPQTAKWDPPHWPPGSAAGKGQVNGLVYLGFAFRGLHGQPARQAIDVGWRFQVRLFVRHDDVLRQALAAFWALLYAGGLGSRTRRGFGTIRVVEPPATALAGLPPLMSTARTPPELAAQLSKGLRAARQALNARDPDAAPGYAALAPNAIEATVLGQVWRSWDAALADIGQLMAAHRQSLSPTMQELLGAPTAQSSYPRAAFGLPIVYYSPATNQSITLEATTISRRASPLWIRPLYLAPKQYAVVLWLSSAPFWPSDSQLKVAKGATLSGNVPSDGVKRFLESCTKRWQGHKVSVS